MNKVEKNKVLIVDDEKSNLEVLVNILSLEYTIYMTKSGSAAFDMASRYMPDIILLDILMPDMSGFEVLTALKASDKTRHIPVIFITGLNRVEDEEKGLDMDASDYIHKPFSGKIVKLRVRNQIKIVNQIRAIEEYAQNMQLTLSKMEAIVNNYKGIIWSVDSKGLITSFNGQYLKTIGLEPALLTGKSIETIRAENNHVNIINIIDNVEKTFSEGPQDWNSGIDDNTFHTHTTPMYDSEGNMIGIVGSTDDVTELIKLHAALKATEEKSKFFAKMSHEMRTPLSAVIGLSELTLEESGLNEEARDNLSKIYNAGSSLLSMVNDILDINKIEVGKFKLEPVEYDTPAMINDAVTQSIMRKGEAPIEFVLNIDENIPIRLYGDDLRIKQILNNLLSNAFKYTKEGTVELNMKIEPEAAEAETIWLTISVKDTGIGIPDEDINKLFVDYGQIDRTSNRKIEGIGLGLSITKMIVDMMGGCVSVESKYGKGSIFTAKLPQKFVTNESIGQDVISNIKKLRYLVNNSNRISQLSRISLPYARVMVVDDVMTNLDVAKGMMKPYKMQVDCLLSGQEAVNAIRDEKARYNAIFMDHMMPGMDGIEATRIIREEIGTEYAKTIPIIAFTANAIAGNEEMFLSRGFQAFLPKPVEIKRLDAIIQQWVRNEELERAYTSDTEQVITGGETFFDIHSGQDRRSGGERRSGYDRRNLIAVKDLDFSKGLQRFDNDIETYLQIIRSFAVNTRLLLNTIMDVNEANLTNYAITVHGIKGSCRGICAESVGVLAEALEKAAKSGDINFVIANNPAFLKAALRLIADIDTLFAKSVSTNKDKPVKDKPYVEVLSKLLLACENYNIEEIETTMKEIEVFRYESDDGLALWLQDNVIQMNYLEIVERLSDLIPKWKV
ncbi:MAG: response regulator [Spirochaetaceae bacterium]|nr:response regulator [Spirochaetaceae bacterium]